MARIDMEKAAAERRMRQRGAEQVSKTGFTVDLVSRLKRAPAQAEAFLEEARGWKPIEEVVERRAAERAQRESHMRAILDACED